MLDIIRCCCCAITQFAHSTTRPTRRNFYLLRQRIRVRRRTSMGMGGWIWLWDTRARGEDGHPSQPFHNNHDEFFTEMGAASGLEEVGL